MGRRRRRRRRIGQEDREKGVAISTPHGTSQAENFVRGKIGDASGGNASGAPTTKGAITAPKTTTPAASSGSWSTPSKKQLEGRPNPVNTLRFSPQSWAKLQWFRDRGSTEIGGFGISLKEEPLYVIDFLTVAQQCTSAHVEFDDDAVAGLLDEMDRKGYSPDEVLRIWLHTHPGNSASPSGQDMNTFHDVFGGSDWAIMVILAKGGECKSRLRYTNGPGAEMELTPQVDLHPPFEGVSGDDYVKWEEEYLAHIRTRSNNSSSSSASALGHGGYQGRGYPSHGSYGSYGGYGGYEDGSSEGWWNERQNDETAGFRNSGAQSSGSCSRGSRSVPSQRNSPRPRLADQSEIPPYGGIYRLATREADEKLRLVNECVEQVWQVDDNNNNTKTVVTDLSWYTFSVQARVNAEVGDDIDSINDISDEAPIACGEVSWRVNGSAQLVPMKITRILSSGETVDLRQNEDVAATELFQAKAKNEDTSAGFAPAKDDDKTDDDKTDDDKTTTEITTTEIHKNWCCVVCEKPIDFQLEYAVANSNGTLGARAHVSCVADKAGWLSVPVRPSRSSKKETEIITVDQAASVAASRGSNDEPGFSPAATDDGSNDGGTAGAGGDGTEPAVPVGP